MKRNVNFYTMTYKASEMLSLSLKKNPEKIHESFINILINSLDEKEYLLKMHKKDENPSVVIELIEINNSQIFGILGRLDDLSNKSLVRIREKKYEKISEALSTDELMYYIENFTYFLIRLSDLSCAVLNNKSAPAFNKYFAMLLENETDYKARFFDNVTIVPKLEKNIHHKISRFKNIASISLAFHNDRSNIGNKVFSINKIFEISESSKCGVGNEIIERASINIDLKTEVSKENLKKQLSQKDIYSDFSDFKIVGTNEDDIEECVDVIKSLLIRKVSIEIEEKYLMSDEGKNKVKEELMSVMPTSLTYLPA